MDTNRGEHNLLILIINDIVQQKQYVGNIWIDILSNIFLLNITVVLPFNISIRNSPSLDTFKKALKHKLFPV